ncbi:hypothetical protein ACFYO8_10670 [Micromonospora sp. NPDC005257]|uniref:hypothetical protein n=1 Tax=Micromonospora sp. NPDC005257 TaxID=3364230 RepID=UPI0036A6E51F
MSEKRGRGRPRIGDRFEIKLPDDQRAYVRAEAARAGCPESAVIRELLAAGIAAKQNQKA